MTSNFLESYNQDRRKEDDNKRQLHLGGTDMTDRQLRRMSRGELLEMLIEQMEENERLKEQLKTMEEELSERRIKIESAGSLAEAALMLNGVFQAADQAARQYLENVKMMAGEKEDDA